MNRSGSIVVHVAGQTDVGLVREHNEDALAVVDLTAGRRVDLREVPAIILGPKGLILVVCDGMGGAAAGEVAATMAVEALCQGMSAAVLAGDGMDERASLARQLRQAAWAANAKILDTARSDPSKGGMGTTMTAVGVLGTNLVVAQVGDSRAYLLREGRLAQLSRDQSLVNELLDNGQITDEEVATFEHSNVILQALGVQEEVEVLLSTAELRQGDRLLVCSDGLSGVVSDEDIAARVAASEDPAEVCRRLVEGARDSGGPDNISAIVARFEGDGLARPQPSDPPARYVRWRLDEPVEVTAAGGQAGEPAPAARRLDAAHVFLSVMVLLACAIGGLIWASLAFRSAPAGRCVVHAAPGLALRVDGLETGLRTARGGMEATFPLGRHRVGLRGGEGVIAERDVEVARGQPCTIQFQEAR